MTESEDYHISRSMETGTALSALASLAQETRLTVFRLLVESGPAGLAAGDIAERLEIPSTTLSFHLKHLRNAALVVAERNGTSICYTASFETMNDLIAYLTDNCCGGDPSACAPQQPGLVAAEE